MAPEKRPERILLVDDDPASLRLMEVIFSHEGYDAALARNGKEALEAARELLPSLIISDILMPGMDGFELCRKWMSDPALNRVPFVFYTATYVSTEARRLALALGAARFLLKPMEPAALAAQVRRVLEAVQRSGPGMPSAVPMAEDEYLRRHNGLLASKLEKRTLDLRRSKQKYALVFECVQAAIAIARLPSGKITDANPAFSSLLGMERDDILAFHLPALFTPEGRERCEEALLSTAPGSGVSPNGSPPRAWGNRNYREGLAAPKRFTPTRVGKFNIECSS